MAEQLQVNKSLFWTIITGLVAYSIGIGIWAGSLSTTVSATVSDITELKAKDLLHDELGRQIERQYMDEIKLVNKRLNGIEKAVSKIAGKLDVDID